LTFTKPPRWADYAIVRIRTGRVLYAGDNLTKAALALEPGTCFGRGATSDLAVQNALAWAERFRSASTW
jgi:hypothetical protein